MSKMCFYDLETRSEVDLKEVGASAYAQHPTTDVLCLAYALDDGPVELWVPDRSRTIQTWPETLLAAAADPLCDWTAHNHFFERQVARRVLEPRYGFPTIPVERQRDSMALAYAAALPGSLEKAVEALGLPYPKDKDGQALMRKMTKPLKGGGWLDDDESHERLQTYCRRDVEAERALYNALPQLTADEQAAMGARRLD